MQRKKDEKQKKKSKKSSFKSSLSSLEENPVRNRFHQTFGGGAFGKGGHYKEALAKQKDKERENKAKLKEAAAKAKEERLRREENERKLKEENDKKLKDQWKKTPAGRLAIKEESLGKQIEQRSPAEDFMKKEQRKRGEQNKFFALREKQKTNTQPFKPSQLASGVSQKKPGKSG